MFLEAHFGDVSVPRTEVPEGEEDDLLVMDVTVDGIVARIDLISMVRPNLALLVLTHVSKLADSRVASRMPVRGTEGTSGKCHGDGVGHYEIPLSGFRR